jgi:hypothetical protein
MLGVRDFAEESSSPRQDEFGDGQPAERADAGVIA